MEAADSRESASARVVAVSFTGTAGEYFRIWIVNTALTIVTLGIYSAWAKVRKLRYFYGNTSIEDGRFDYHASPKAILIGRIIAVSALFIYYLLSQYRPLAGLALIVIIILLIPVLVVRARVFQMRNTSYHGLRFNFQRNYKDSFKAFYGGAIVTILSLGLAAPSAIYWRNRFVANNTAFGQTPFRFSGEQGEFYKIFWASVGLAILGVLAIMLVSALIGGAATEMSGGSAVMAQVVAFMTVIPLLAFYAAIGVFVQVRQKNYVWNTTGLGGNNFESTLSVRDMVWIYLSNAAAIVVSLGMLIPWAQIRLARYRAEHMTIYLADDWRDYVASRDSQGSALGEEIGEAFDVDIDIAF